ncbi:MAG: twin-arginine translocase TatA/TatE family subunit [Candidatus Neomarinimicrobiota bacterium]
MNNYFDYAGMPGGWEWIIVALVVLLLFGAKRLPELARGLGQGIREFKGAISGAKDEINEAKDSLDTDPDSEEKSKS